MVSYNPRFIDVASLDDARAEIRLIGSDEKSVEIMAPKAVSRVVKLDDVVLQDAIIIKQDMLSVGGEVAIPKDAFELKAPPSAILIMGTVKQHHDLISKLRRHYPRIQKIAGELDTLLQEIM